MALFFDDFDGPADQWIKDRPGWAHLSGYHDTLKTDGSGNVALAYRENDGRAVAHDTGSVSQYAEVVIGAGFIAGNGEVELVVGAGNGQWLGVSYSAADSEFVVRLTGGTGVGTYSSTPNPGDTLTISYLNAGNLFEVRLNGTVIISGDITAHSPSYGTKAGISPSYSSSAARSDVIRSFKADAYSGPPDTTPPTLTSATGTATGDTTASGSVTTNEAGGTLYYVTTGNATETAAAVKAGASQAVTAAGVQNISVTGLPSGTTLRHHYLHQDPSANDSAVLSSGTFTTTAPDVTAPTLTSPTATATGSTTATGAVSTNEANGTLYWLASGNATESVATVKTGQSQPVSVTGVQGVSVAGLTAATSYYLHFVHRDAAGNDSARVTSAQFTTFAAAGTPKITPPQLRNNTGTLLAGEAGATVHVYEVANGNKVATVTGCASDAAGMMMIQSASMAAGTEYRAVIVLASGAEGLQKATATT